MFGEFTFPFLVLFVLGIIFTIFLVREEMGLRRFETTATEEDYEVVATARQWLGAPGSTGIEAVALGIRKAGSTVVELIVVEGARVRGVLAPGDTITIRRTGDEVWSVKRKP